MTDLLDAAIAGASGFEDEIERLETAFPGMAPAGLDEVLVKGMVKARGLGDARDE